MMEANATMGLRHAASAALFGRTVTVTFHGTDLPPMVGRIVETDGTRAVVTVSGNEWHYLPGRYVVRFADVASIR